MLIHILVNIGQQILVSLDHLESRPVMHCNSYRVILESRLFDGYDLH